MHFNIMCFSSSKRMLSFLLYASFAEHRCIIWALSALSPPLLTPRNKYHTFHISFRLAISVQKLWAQGIWTSGDCDQYRTAGFPHLCHVTVLVSATLVIGQNQHFSTHSVTQREKQFKVRKIISSHQSLIPSDVKTQLYYAVYRVRLMLA